MNSHISIHDLQKNFNHVPLYSGLNMEIEAGKITAIFGPNGSGKSTLLNILSKVTLHDGGAFEIKDFRHFEFSYIFQNYRESLMPWKTNYDNLALPLKLQKKKTKEMIDARIRELQDMFELNIDWNGYPYQLSGGQQQILAFMRALVTNPKLLFIDEPFSSLDYENNLRLRKHLQEYYLKYKPTIVLITHNIEEAVHLSHQILVLGKRPTSITSHIENHLAFPRTVETMSSPEFEGVKAKALKAFACTVSI